MNGKKVIAIASDHAGFELKEKLVLYLRGRGYECVDLGTDSSESVDYPVYANKLCDYLLGDGAETGILICGTGIGMSIAANRHKGIRAALCLSTEEAILSRQHNNANVLCLGTRTKSIDNVFSITDAFLDTDFLGGRHDHRTAMLDM